MPWLGLAFAACCNACGAGERSTPYHWMSAALAEVWKMTLAGPAIGSSAKSVFRSIDQRRYIREAPAALNPSCSSPSWRYLKKICVVEDWYGATSTMREARTASFGLDD